MELKFNDQSRLVLLLIFGHFIFRLFVAVNIELSIDEAYYALYALYPEWSYFDHPPMVGQLIRLTTLGMNFPTELSMRLGPLLIGSVNLYWVYKIGVLISGHRVGLFAMVMTIGSVYICLITGVFIMPDAPQSLFWLISILCFIQYLKKDKIIFLLGFCFTCGLALLSKYHSVFLIVGALFYFLVFAFRKKNFKEVLFVLIIPILIFLPVLIWNYQHEFMSFTFHENRVGNSEFTITWNYFLTELLGQIFYINLFNAILVVIGIRLVIKNWAQFNRDAVLVFLYACGLPLIAIVLIMSFFNQTLPHWSGPAYFSLFLATAYVLEGVGILSNSKRVRRLLKWGIGFLVFTIGLGLAHFNWGVLPMEESSDPDRMGMHDISLDSYGWGTLKEQFNELAERDVAFGIMDSSFSLITRNWFPAGHIDFYFGFSEGRDLFVTDKLTEKHQYHFTNKYRGGIPPGGDAYFITSSRHYYPPKEDLLQSFESVDEPVKLYVYRSGKPTYFLYIYRLRGATKRMFGF